MPRCLAQDARAGGRMTPLVAFGLKGLLGYPPPWGFDYSAGMDVLAAKLRAAGAEDGGMYGWTEWRSVVAKIQAVPLGKLIMIYGHSMGANQAAACAAAMKCSVALIAGYDPTVWYACPALGPNVKRAICFHGTNIASLVGHEKYSALTKATRLDIVNTNDLHQNIDDDNGLHGITLRAVRETMGA